MGNDCSEENHGPHHYFELGDFELENGITLPTARIGDKTHGTLNEAKDNVILFPRMWWGTPKAMEIFIGAGRPLDPRTYFIILPGQFANGFSSSPSNSPPPFNGGAFPTVTIGDDVRAQHRLPLRPADRWGCSPQESRGCSPPFCGGSARSPTPSPIKQILGPRLLGGQNTRDKGGVSA